MQNNQKYQPQNVIAVDVDGTLLLRDRLNAPLIEWCRRKKREGFVMMLWSARGQEHAERAAQLAQLKDVFDIIISKPGYILDDQGWSWIKYTHIIKTFD